MERTTPYSWIGAAIKGMLSAGNRQRKSMQRRMVSRSFVLKPVHFGMLRRTRPFSTHWDDDPGLPIDRYYIHQFLSAHAADIRGRVLEIRDNTYTYKFGTGQVTQSDVLHVQEGLPGTTIVADLTRGDNIPSDTFDCIILTQTLQFIYDVHSTVRTLYRILKPRGILLATFPGISQISRRDMNRWGEYWRFTTLSSQKCFAEVFAEEQVTVEAYGNVLSAITFLHALPAENL